ncbi:MAG TPA: hypothetical protein VGK19_18310 [Capsulimonadaceae bacterium]
MTTINALFDNDKFLGFTGLASHDEPQEHLEVIELTKSQRVRVLSEWRHGIRGVSAERKESGAIVRRPSARVYMAYLNRS